VEKRNQYNLWDRLQKTLFHGFGSRLVLCNSAFVSLFFLGGSGISESRRSLSRRSRIFTFKNIVDINETKHGFE
jgi:hypothetical protein